MILMVIIYWRPDERPAIQISDADPVQRLPGGSGPAGLSCPQLRHALVGTAALRIIRGLRRDATRPLVLASAPASGLRRAGPDRCRRADQSRRIASGAGEHPQRQDRRTRACV